MECKMKTLKLTDEEVEVLAEELDNIRDCLKESCECAPNTPICDSCKRLPIIRSILLKL
jgi:hypothetical protein